MRHSFFFIFSFFSGQLLPAAAAAVAFRTFPLAKRSPDTTRKYQRVSQNTLRSGVSLPTILISVESIVESYAEERVCIDLELNTLIAIKLSLSNVFRRFHLVRTMLAIIC